MKGWMITWDRVITAATAAMEAPATEGRPCSGRSR